MSTSSFVHGASDVPLLYETIGQAFDRIAVRFSARDALIVPHQNVRWTYAQLKQRVDDLAAAFVALGLAPGDRIGIWAPNCAEWTLTQFASAKAGLILVNINPAYRLTELEFALNKVGCKALVTAAQFKTSNYIEMLNTLAPELAASAPGSLQAKRLPQLRWLIRLGDQLTSGCLTFDQLASRVRPEHRERITALANELQPDEPINIQFTSGTTGLPKGATLSHFNILNNGYFVARALHLSERDRMCIPVPLYHCFGMVMGNLGCVTHGAAMVYPSEGFDPQLALQTVARERCTVLYGVPTMFIAELDHPEFKTFDLTSLRTGIMAGAPCPIEVMKRVTRDMHMSEITIAYGMTETSPVSFQSSVDDPFERRVSTVGRIHPHLQVKIADEHDRIVPRGVQGQLLTRGYSVMSGYWDDAEKTREAIDAAGWMRTGDLATLDSDGYCNITGRLKDIVIRGGENISPREVEDYLYRHPSIQAAQAFGVPDPKYGEELCVWIQLQAGSTLSENGVREFCSGQIAHHKIPRHIRFVTEFPMTVTGKVQKFVMREAMCAELGLSAAQTA